MFSGEFQRIIRSRPRLRSTALLVLFLNILLVSALPENLRAEEEALQIRPAALVQFAAGAIFAFAVHEGAHETAACLTGNSLSWDSGTLNQPMQFTEDADSNTDGFLIDAAGLVSQLGLSEAILDMEGIDNDSPFVRGMVAWNFVNPIMYSLDYWWLHRTNKDRTYGYQGDIQGIEYHKGKDTANAFCVSIIAISLWQGYRYLKTQSWAPDWARTEALNHLEVRPQPQGMAVVYDIDF